MPNELIPVRFDAAVVLLSVLVACLASYTALDLARRVHENERWGTALWVAAGALVMGSGIWAMHFIGMLAMAVPFAFGFAPGLTALSWVAAVAVSALALGIAARDRLTAATLTAGALAMGGGVCAMHYTGMAAMVMAPGISWHAGWVTASAVIAVSASAVALLIFFGLRRLQGWRQRAAQGGAALAMGLAISGMHYAGMAAAGYPEGSVCLSADGLGGRNLGLFILVAVGMLMAIALFTAALDARMSRSLHKANAELRRMAFVDALTGLPNRALLQERLQQAVAEVDRVCARPMGDASLALLFVDLDGFKPVNDGLGHAAGDEVLVQVAQRLRALALERATLTRLGGDEFVLLLDDGARVHDAVGVAGQVLRSLQRPFAVRGREVVLSASIGIITYPGAAASDQLLTAADAAMYAAKRAGGATYAVFERRMLDEASSAQLELLQDLRSAAELGQLALHYQPKVDSRSGQVRSVEALLRWTHPQRGPVSPAVFVPLAERYGLISAIGSWVIDEACRQLAAWVAEGRRLRVSINLSPYQLRQPDIGSRVGAALARNGLQPDQLLCEITESAAMEDTQTTQRVLDALGAQGVKLSIDDFGTGYSSLAKLRRMRADELKIDREFVADVARDDDARAVVDAIVRLGHALGMRVVAEGVETAEQRDALVALGCDELQGYLYARPLPPQALLHDDPAAPLRPDFSPSVLMDV